MFSANSRKQALFGFRGMLPEQLEIRVLGEPPVPFCFKMALVST